MSKRDTEITEACEGVPTELLRKMLANKKEIARQAQADGARNTMKAAMVQINLLNAEITRRTTEENSLAAYYSDPWIDG